MPFCPKCGKEVPPGALYCPYCGASLVTTPTTTTPTTTAPPYEMKNPGIAALLAAIIGLVLLGIGHIYVGKITRGLVLLFTGLVLDGLLIASLFFSWLIFPIFFTIILGIAALALWVWSIYDAYKLAKQYNDYLRTYGKPPW